MDKIRTLKEPSEDKIQIIEISSDEIDVLKRIKRGEEIYIRIKPLDDIIEKYKDYFKDDINISTLQKFKKYQILTLYSPNEAIIRKEFDATRIITIDRSIGIDHIVLTILPIYHLFKDIRYNMHVEKDQYADAVAYAFLGDSKLTDEFKEDVRRNLYFKAAYYKSL